MRQSAQKIQQQSPQIIKKAIQKPIKLNEKQNIFQARTYFQLPQGLDEDVKQDIYQNYGPYEDIYNFTVEQIRQDHKNFTDKQQILNKKNGLDFSDKVNQKLIQIPKNYFQSRDLQLKMNFDNDVMNIYAYYLKENDTNNVKNDKAMIFYHGGGFVRGHPDEYSYMCQRIAYEYNMNVFSVEYRKAPEYKFPIGIQDSVVACQYIFDNCEQLGINKEKIVVCGNSAGGCVASMVAYYQQKFNYNIQLQILLNPVCDWKFDKYKSQLDSHPQITPDLATVHMEWYKNQYFNKETIQQDLASTVACPNNILVNELRNVAPTLLVLSEFDALYSEGLEYGKNLNITGKLYQEIIYKGVMHDFYMKYNLNRSKQFWKETGQIVRDFTSQL